MSLKVVSDVDDLHQESFEVFSTLFAHFPSHFMNQKRENSNSVFRHFPAFHCYLLFVSQEHRHHEKKSKHRRSSRDDYEKVKAIEYCLN